MTFGEKLQRLRRGRGWSQEQLAERIAVSRQALSKWERGAAKPDVDYVVALSRLFAVSADALLRDELELPGTGEGDAEPGQSLPAEGLALSAGAAGATGSSAAAGDMVCPLSAGSEGSALSTRPAEDRKTDRRGRWVWALGGVLAGLGGLGQAVVWLLSTMITVFIPPESVEVGQPDLAQESWERGYGVFVEHYHLQALTGLFWALLALGAAVLAAALWRRWARRA